jgi:hypothetical protein
MRRQRRPRKKLVADPGPDNKKAAPVTRGGFFATGSGEDQPSAAVIFSYLAIS